MSERTIEAGDFSHPLPEALNEGWEKLCRRYLPVVAEKSIWRYSRERSPQSIEQGWKLHISATVLTANKVLEKIAPFLSSRRVRFKAPVSLHELVKLNSGTHYGYSQIGKTFTVYPSSIEEALFLAKALHRLTRRLDGPAIPFDRRYKPNSSVYYRYGAFIPLEMENQDGSRAYALRDPLGNLTPDSRESPEAQPEWVSDPFPTAPLKRGGKRTASPLETSYYVIRALRQRGKGGVYQAIDCSSGLPRLCILKEGRRNGELSWEGRDGYWRVKREERILRSLRECGIMVPKVYSSFETEGNYYLVTEFIAGSNLQTLLDKRRRRFSVPAATAYALSLAELLAQIHAAGWAWRDCKPANLIVTGKGALRPVDFEGANSVEQPDTAVWATAGFAPPEACMEFNGRSRIPEDLYSLGAIIYLLLAGDLPRPLCPVPVERLRRNIPSELRKVVAELLDSEPQQRPAASAAARRLKALPLSSMD